MLMVGKMWARRSEQRQITAAHHTDCLMQGSGYLTCGACVGSGSGEDGGGCNLCSGTGKVMCTACLCTGAGSPAAYDWHSCLLWWQSSVEMCLSHTRQR
jgi:hypothetical protein